MTITLVNLCYPYGGRQIYLNHSLVSVMSRILSTRSETKFKFIDYNIDDFDPEVFRNCEKIGVSLLGAPYIPTAIEFVRKIQQRFPGKEVAIGGQIVEHISRAGFATVFQSLPVRQIVSDSDFADWIGVDVLPNSLEVSCIPAWKQLDPARLREYLKYEMTLETSQGCKYGCKFCAAHKVKKEQLKDLAVFESDLRYLVRRAHEFDLRSLSFYASALDFFQNPDKKEEVLKILSRVREELGVDIRVRCLTCMSTFLDASKSMQDFPNLLHGAGMECIGFGVDGTAESWKREKKGHNRAGQVQRCVDLCRQLGIRAELLMVLGFPEDSLATLWKTLKNCIGWGFRQGVVLRPYMAKAPVPGNDYWDKWERIFVEDPQKFYDIDYFAIQSKIVDSLFWHRWACNLTYLAIIGLLYPLGKCSSIFLLPHGYGTLARIINSLMPADR